VADRLERALEHVRAQLRAGWPVLVDTTSWRLDGDELTVSGGVLTAAQAKRYVELLGEALPGVTVTRPPLLSALDRPWQELEWATITGDGPLDLHRAPDGHDLQTQWEPPAHLRRFAERGDRALVQLPDGTLGWAEPGRLEDATPRRDPWADIARPRFGRSVPVGAGGGLAEAAERARERLGRPYLWGGNSAAAADCSGLVQALVWAGGGVLLPKHTGDQRRFGRRVAASAIRPGDLVFVRGRERGLGHVGLALPGDGGTTVVHSCLSRRRVLEEPLEAFLDRYLFSAARRVVDW